jgi:mono/diheme cytochrome c family protein
VRRAAATLILGPCLLLGGAACAEEPGDAARGAIYAQKVCAECHGVLAGDERSPNIDAPPFQSVVETSGMTHRALVVWLQSSHPTMPNIMIDRNDRDDVVAYIMSLKAKR